MNNTISQDFEKRIDQVLDYVKKGDWKFSIACGMCSISHYHLDGPMQLKKHPKIIEARELSNKTNTWYFGRKPKQKVLNAN